MQNSKELPGITFLLIAEKYSDLSLSIIQLCVHFLYVSLYRIVHIEVFQKLNRPLADQKLVSLVSGTRQI